MTEIREYDIAAMGAEKKNNKSRMKKSLIIFGCIIAGIIVLALIGSSIKDSIWGEDKDIQASGPYIATIYVEGTIVAGQTDSLGLPAGYQHNWTLDKIDELIGDPNNRGLIVFVDSPGGGVYESDELYLKLKEYKKPQIARSIPSWGQWRRQEATIFQRQPTRSWLTGIPGPDPSA